MSDVTALVLTLGERTLQRALRRLDSQTHCLADIVIVRGLTPFHVAFNSGLSEVKTKFFVQVDADMSLHPACIEVLRENMTEGVAIVTGPLRDPLCGREIGVKLFRVCSFDEVGYQDSLSPDTDFNRCLTDCGWEIKYMLNRADPSGDFGEHAPVYTRAYGYQRFLILGARYRYRRSPESFQWRYRNLSNSRHPLSLPARVAMAHGLFISYDRDILMPVPVSDDCRFLYSFLSSRASAPDDPPQPSLEGSLNAVFQQFLDLGRKYGRLNTAADFVRQLRGLESRDDVASWVARIALCEGIFSRNALGDRIARLADDLINDFGPRMPAGINRS
jgi:hypothetical protein